VLPCSFAVRFVPGRRGCDGEGERVPDGQGIYERSAVSTSAIDRCTRLMNDPGTLENWANRS
jgi:hypothetical protein